MQKKSLLNGLVLCGGRSTRMNNDKSEIYYHNKSQREYLFDMLSLHCNETFISCNAEQLSKINGIPAIKDVYVNDGPLGGILSAFQHNKNVAWLTVACDMPFLNEETITYLINHRNTSKIATTFWNNETKFIEPLITIWEPQAYDLLIDFFKQGNKSPRKFLMDNEIELLEISNVSVLKNVNTKDEYDEVINILKRIDLKYH